jgi:hypothetical protein
VSPKKTILPGYREWLLRVSIWFATLSSPAAGPVCIRHPESGWFYWSTYAAVWIVPALALWLGIRGRDRVLIDLGWLAALATILTSKSYLSWPRQTWDPILLGILLMGTAVALRRWLAKGPNGERAGFTPLRVLDSENRALAAASALSLVLPHAPPTSPSEPSFKPGGGQSGGGGASGDFK